MTVLHIVMHTKINKSNIASAPLSTPVHFFWHQIDRSCNIICNIWAPTIPRDSLDDWTSSIQDTNVGFSQLNYVFARMRCNLTHPMFTSVSRHLCSKTQTFVLLLQNRDRARWTIFFTLALVFVVELFFPEITCLDGAGGEANCFWKSTGLRVAPHRIMAIDKVCHLFYHTRFFIKIITCMHTLII